MSDTSRLSIGAELVHLNEAVSHIQLSFLKVACSALSIPFCELEGLELFTDVYKLIEDRRTSETPSLVYKILSRLGVGEGQLMGLANMIQTEATIEDNILLDLILSVTAILIDLSERKYASLKELARRTYFDYFASANIKSRSHLLHLLLDRDLLTPEKFSYLYAWLEVIGCPAHHKTLNDFCERHGIVEPDWRSQLDACRSNFVPIMTSDPVTDKSDVIQDGPTHSSYPPAKGQLTKPSCADDRPRNFNECENIGQIDVSSSSAGVSPTNGGQTTIAGISYAPVPSTDDTSSKGMMVASKPGFGSINMVHPIRGGQQESLSDPDTQFNLDEAVEDFTPHDVNQVPVVYPSNYGTSPYITESRKRPSYVRETSDDSQTGLITITAKRPRKKFHCCMYSSVFLFCGMWLISWMLLSGGLSYHFIGSPPLNTTYSIGGLNTIMINDDCYDPFHVESLTIAKAGPIDQYNRFDTDVYLINKDNLKITPIKLHSKTWYISELYNNRIGINYYQDDDSPIYTADAPSAYFINITASYNATLQPIIPSSCPLKVYLFDNSISYNNFRNDDWHNPPTDAIDSSQCIPVTDVPQSLELPLPKRGFYYIALSISGGTSASVDVSPLIQSFDVSQALPDQCKLDEVVNFCHYPIGASDEIDGSTCVLVRTRNDVIQNVTVHVQEMVWNMGSILSASLGAVAVSCGFIILCLFTCYVGVSYMMKRRR